METYTGGSWVVWMSFELGALLMNVFIIVLGWTTAVIRWEGHVDLQRRLVGALVK
jgi:hypothetical protein